MAKFPVNEMPGSLAGNFSLCRIWYKEWPLDLCLGLVRDLEWWDGF
jgi:hypothetical protein